jgi:hypothetical protein
VSTNFGTLIWMEEGVGFSTLLKFLHLLTFPILVVSVFFYGFLSIALTFFNKFTLSSYEFNAPFFLLWLQSVVTIVSSSFSRPKAIPSKHRRLVSFSLLQFTTQISVLAVVYVANASLSLSTLSGLHVAVYKYPFVAKVEKTVLSSG